MLHADRNEILSFEKKQGPCATRSRFYLIRLFGLKEHIKLHNKRICYSLCRILGDKTAHSSIIDELLCEYRDRSVKLCTAECLKLSKIILGKIGKSLEVLQIILGHILESEIGIEHAVYILLHRVLPV